MSIKCIAIDDEPLALRQMKMYIDKSPYLESVGLFSNGTSALKFLENNTVELMFVDINMPDVNGLALVRSLENPPYIIFTTAYSEYAIESYKIDAIDYLLKPISIHDFNKAVEKVHSLIELINYKNEHSATDDSASESEPAQKKEFLSIKADHKTMLVKVDNIVFIESVGEYVRINMEDGTKHVALFRMKNIIQSLPSDTFIRVHRSYIVNKRFITSYTKGRIYLTGKDYVSIGENYKDDFIKLIEG